MTAKSANGFESFGSLTQFYPKLGASIAFGVMAAAANTMKAFVNAGGRSAEHIEATSEPAPPIPARVRLTRRPKKKRPAVRKSTKRSTHRRKSMTMR